MFHADSKDVGNPTRGSTRAINAAREIPGLKRAMTTEGFEAAKAASAAYSGDYAKNSIDAMDVQHGPGSQLARIVQRLIEQSESLSGQLVDLHSVLGGSLPDKTGGSGGGIAPTPCGGQIGALIDATRRIEHNLDGCSDIMGYLRALTA